MRIVDCDSYRLACNVERIANNLDGFDWSAVLAALIGSVPAALIAAVIAFVVFRGEGKERYEVRLVDAVESLTRLLTKYAKENEVWFAALISYFAHGGAENSDIHRPIDPDRADLDVSLDVLLARTKGSDRVIAEQFRGLVYELTFIEDPVWLTAEYATVRRVMAAWCSRRKSEAEILSDIATIETRRRLKEVTPSIKEDALPRSPEAYKRPNFGVSS